MKHLRLEIFPKKTIAMIQPLDITFNRQYKHVVRTIYDHVRLYDIDCNLPRRNNVIKLTSLCYSQLCSKKFIPMHRYSWFQGGYLEKNPGSYQNVEEFCFRFQDYSCHENQCNGIPLIRCSFCEKVLCFYYFFLWYHVITLKAITFISSSSLLLYFFVDLFRFEKNKIVKFV